MSDKVYSPKELALELGFTEAEADHYERRGTNATNLRKIARAMDMPSTKPTIGKPDGSKPESKKHRHSYRKDGTCACGARKKVKKA